MGKTELVEKVAERAGLSKSSAAGAIDATLAAIGGELAKGGSVTLVGFGTFEVRQRAAREGRNPHTGAPLQIEAKKSIGFKVSKKLVDSIN